MPSLDSSHSTVSVRGRFAPSPSGHIHIGNALAALIAWLQIRSQHGEFVLRMEDIDVSRCRPAFAVSILDDLRWLGLDWDEGPDVGGPFAPYTQSERLDLYEEALNRLLDDGRLYPCYCSRHDILAAAAAPHGLSSEGPVYPGTCRNLTPEEAASQAQAKSPSLRFRVEDKTLCLEDGIAGLRCLNAATGGDFIIRRADGIYSYQLAVVVDDARMGITDVLRGADLLDSTPRQLLLYEALGWQAPRFAHVPLLMGPDGRRLAKRHGGITLAELRTAGVTPAGVTGWLAWVIGLIPEPAQVAAWDLIPLFGLTKLKSSDIVVTPDMLGRLHSSLGGA
ncbi:tRNA glutamyl-Q(34) synthetase GluQRS [Paenibacillus sp. HN-1]|uniref:tRNA glutamyl-Q(34) synthetase GluQRS n=1 Tax=Paenibacillus TaxID=44249 RepID=UPI001CA88F3E|nr:MULTISPECIES: tRNA glutamyl-Q(34) synthetase GluQRS [Paenibacillus]MBY9078476.1 tRNA glutamyl-Q(34) synthetase GluQRS [Paenibacillus sp. CGMCC 1.18879]MBY9082769.1 tRNA glutamyl-Q(34) synthetase GluQRS [Paenibacillus sinensis]